MDYLKENADFKWGLETVGKYINEELDNMKNNDASLEFEIPAFAKGSVKIIQHENGKYKKEK